jgi:ABC-type branched-subunit amino acid transport system substrate-binding protein
VISIDKKRAFLIFFAIILVILAAWAVYGMIHANTPVRIGVLLPLGEDLNLKEPLEWAREKINDQGGIGGRPVEFVYKDTESGDINRLAEELLADDSIRVVIGPCWSNEVFLVAPAFISREKLLISPLATSGDIFRAFGKKGYFWRTMQGDVAQVKAIMTLLKQKGAKRAALLTADTTYGKTFYEWTGFFANEYGIDLVFIRQFEQGSDAIDKDVLDALQADPDTIIAICEPSDAAKIKQAIDRSGKPVELFLADAAVSQELVRTLGDAAEGIEGTSPTADPSSGFAAAYRERFGHPPADYAAPVYDAVLLAAYASARQDASLFESPADSMKHVVYGSGTKLGWDATASKEAIRAILAGESPDITGASGPLDYDREYGVDPVAAYYSHWILEGGLFRTVEVLSSAKSGTDGGSLARSHASEGLMELTETEKDGYVPPVDRNDFMAVIVGPSAGWTNYRHQADALGVYTMLRENGVPDEKIILMLYDDVPYARENPIKGDVHNIPAGENLRYGAVVDYSGNEVTPAALESVLMGKPSETAPVVLDSDSGTDLFVYIASHGEPGGISFFTDGDTFSAEDFTRIADTMYREGRYRQIVFFVDTCFGESIGVNATSPGLLYFTGAAAGEPSFGAVYDIGIRQWLSDEFTSTVMNAIRADPEITFRELYVAAYEKVTGSHVRLLNEENFGNIDIPVTGYLSP